MDKEKNRLESIGRLCEVVAQLRGPGGMSLGPGADA